ncbi:MAG: hypothetical protein Harvfovirus24_17 [Harvfovirus sp.]|uniref:Uncharacterized protein n=1 Tax=Harvfovirus sp. TaxID=2487768 RepID=A0A3G5A4Y5_9VIRU|nr:MAG: hypothetical protein Harvfovirus24_17 [Harvfovirus sp.]
MKRSRNISDDHGGKKRKGDVVVVGEALWNSLNSVEGDDWVSATAIRNYMLNDPILDWLDKYYVDLGFNNGEQVTDEMRKGFLATKKREQAKLSILFDNGNIFEKAVLDELLEKYPNDMVIVGKSFRDVTRENYEKTLNYMKEGVPIIAQGILFNDRNNTRGMADLLMRNDYISKIFAIGAADVGCEKYYSVVDIKWTTLQLCANGKLIRNGDKIGAYKGQLAIYNCALGNAMNYYPRKAYILGHSWRYEKCGDKFNGSSCFDLLGEIDYEQFDKEFIGKTAEAIRWVRNVREEGSKWSVVPPSVVELYPNMSNSSDTPWSKVKESIAKEIEELTQLWMVGPKNRNIGHKNGVFSWSQKGCTAASLGIQGKKIAPILNKIIDINQSDDDLSPRVIMNNDFSWQQETNLDLYVDFETVNGCFLKKPTNIYNNHSENNIIFLIGMGYGNMGKWKFDNFKMESLNIDCEENIIDRWIERVDELCCGGRARIFHWGNAEFTSLNLANRRHGNKWDKWLQKVVWIDLCRIFQDEPIVVKGAFRFKLKDIAKNMYRLKMIESTWDVNIGIGDGFSAMVDAISYYNGDQPSIVMTNIESYNEIDCKVMWEIVNFLRRKN